MATKTKTANLDEVVRYCDRALRTGEFKDYDGACNGLQVENDGRVSSIAAAVDGSLATVKMAVTAGADLLIVHHGLFWGPSHPWTGRRRQLLRLLLDRNVAVYSSHLPLDAHPRLGNNALLCAALGLKNATPFFAFQDQSIGLKAKANVRRAELVKRLEKATGVKPTVLPGGPATSRVVGVVTGGAGGEVAQAAREGVDTFITGEGPHWTYALAEDLGINVLYGGHYATETFGVQALAAAVSKRFNLPWRFLDHPTGL